MEMIFTDMYNGLLAISIEQMYAEMD